MNRWWIGVFAASLFLMAAGTSYALVDQECYRACRDEQERTSQVCTSANIRECQSECYYEPDARAFMNGAEIFGKFDERLQVEIPPIVNACFQCEEQRNQSNGGSDFACAVTPSSTQNLCTELDRNFVATVNVSLVPKAVFELGRLNIPWDRSLIHPCFDVPNAEFTNGTVPCLLGTQVGGNGCKETKRLGTGGWGTQCAIFATACCNAAGGNGTCAYPSTADPLSDGNTVGVY